MIYLFYDDILRGTAPVFPRKGKTGVVPLVIPAHDQLWRPKAYVVTQGVTASTAFAFVVSAGGTSFLLHLAVNAHQQQSILTETTSSSFTAVHFSRLSQQLFCARIWLDCRETTKHMCCTDPADSHVWLWSAVNLSLCSILALQGCLMGFFYFVSPIPACHKLA